MHIIGIDPGLSGGIAMLNIAEPQIIIYDVMPIINGEHRELDTTRIYNLFKMYTEVHVVIEKAQSMPGQGVASSFTIGRNYGILVGMLCGLKLPHSIVHPRTWQKVMFRDVRHDDTKQASLVVSQRLWPNEDFKQSERCKKAHDGITDACMLAEYGRRMLSGNLGA